MHLVSCAAPSEPLEVAPRSALFDELTEGERWEAFWSADVYLVRCTKSSGQVEWFRVADDERRETTPARASTARVLNFPSHPRLQTRVVIAQSPDGRRMLVGSASRAGHTSNRRIGK